MRKISLPIIPVEGEPPLNYRDRLLYSVNTAQVIMTAEGLRAVPIQPDELLQRVSLAQLIKKAPADGPLLIEDAEWNQLVGFVNQASWGGAVEQAADFIKAIREAAEVTVNVVAEAEPA